MKEEKETKEKLLLSARKEFAQKGYLQASLRNICKNAGVTTGALYFFFQDKEDLFAAIVEKPLQKLYQVMEQHYREEFVDASDKIQEDGDIRDDIEASRQILHCMYSNYEDIQILLTRAQGSRFENCIDELVSMSEKHYREIADQITEQYGKPRIEDYMIHWLAHMQIDAFVQLVTHEKDEQAAISHIEDIVCYLIGGWRALFMKHGCI